MCPLETAIWEPGTFNIEATYAVKKQTMWRWPGGDLICITKDQGGMASFFVRYVNSTPGPTNLLRPV